MANFITKILKSKIVISLAVIGVLSLVLILSSSIYLKKVTHHGKIIFTPSFKGLTSEEASELATEKDIKIEIIDSVYISFAEPGTIVDQTPKANFMIKRGRTIFIVVKAKGQKIVEVPNLSAQSLTQARSVLESAGLMVGIITFKNSPNNHRLILEQSIDPGTEVVAGTKVDLVVGEESGHYAVVPNLDGLSLNDAIFKAAENNLNIGNIVYDNTVISAQDTFLSVVWKQSINAGVKTDYGHDVNIWLTVDPSQY
ncbi:MAG: PASTA domain-containing protein [Bacteroidales bacterium]|nr:PASTA domain-containing protein [Bacteroidales bacterium]